MRRRLIVGNWKMHMTPEPARQLASGLLARSVQWPSDVEVAVCPSFVSLQSVAEVVRGSRIALGAQTMHWEGAGAFTGEVSAEMLLTVGCTHVILGHSERRHSGESDEVVNRKLIAALRSGLKPVVCVGESLEERKAGRTEDVVLSQVEVALQDAEDSTEVCLAYEPIWAIGTGQAATADQAEQVHHSIRECLARKFGREAAALRILYGGSMTPENAGALFNQDNIDGGLIGGASLQADSFSAIVKAGS